MIKKVFLLVLFLSSSLILFSQQYNILNIEKRENILSFSLGNEKFNLEVCVNNILKIECITGNQIYSPSPIIDKKTWNYKDALISTENDSIRIKTNRMDIVILNNPFRFSISDNNHWLIKTNTKIKNQTSIQFDINGKNFYGISNRPTGDLTTNCGDSIYSGDQGHAGAPFIWTTDGYGILFDSDRGKISIKDGNLDFTSPELKNQSLAFYIIVGNPNEIFTGLTEITGKPPLFPKWSLGFMNSEWGIDQDELIKQINTYRQKKIPIDGYILDFDWMDWGNNDYGEFKWGPKFPGAENGNLKKQLDQVGIKLLGIRKPRIHLNTEQGKYAEKNNFFLDHQVDYFSKEKVGLLDFYKSEVRKWYWDMFIEKGKGYQNGIVGYWNDEADAYGSTFMFTYMQKAQYEGQRSFNNQRVFSLNRNFFLGNQKYAYTLWSGDIDSGFNVMSQQKLFMLSSVNTGVSWWSMDIGGFKHNPSQESYFRWIQFGAFVPVYRVHGSYNHQRQPWYYGDRAEAVAKKYIHLRYELIPYIYSYVWESYNTGVSISKPLIFNYPDDPKVANEYSEYLFGNEILVSPIVTQNKNEKLSVYLPKGEWFNYWTGDKFIGPTTIDFKTDSEDIPVFIKAGAIIPTQKVGSYVDDPKISSTLIVNCYAGPENTFALYNDDGKTYDYEKGIYSITLLTQNRNNNSIIFTVSKSEGSYKSKVNEILMRFSQCDSKPVIVSLNNQLLEEKTIESFKTGWYYDNQRKVCVVQIPFDGFLNKIVINF